MSKRWHQERNFARAEWIAGVAHDIRTPLSMVLGYSATLEKDPTLTKLQQQQLSIVKSQSELIKKSIADINLINKLDFNYIEKKRFPVAPILREVLADVINCDLEEKYEFELQLPDKPIFLMGDADLFKRLIQNLIRNSLKHNPNGCAINISACNKKKEVHIIIEDTGYGFSQDKLKLLKSDTSNLNLQANHGLGLKIVRKIVVLHNSKINFSNTSIGGACVKMSFNCSKNGS
ncbi:hypothetical protein AN639_00420 [Candidatus Epulonipiscium fishelsonii]|uniref:Uncharacterized protein n=1 Tax=Candidatus Epulonipiscium fishelsonii TaxID=77094 RepID=A0ACC8XCU1_9FIRM|nr:hypothetical protein AN396_05360 [Epulopiscium sp. SCG-B11WGA-EpuloA1]ONI41850.1 hypothetical protein AN639_00420 [Epulopiscium sp. SCG-B05WGA-EpuloA1]